tara:strand:- start:36 stop:335 length:300 start_codon:yes stop_codon:yes gene_type:complete
MSLTITSPITTIEGFEVATSFGRVAVADQINGEYIDSQLSIFTTEQAFLDGKQPLNAEVELYTRNPYHRDGMGTDILDLAHDNLINLLAGQNIVATKNL